MSWERWADLFSRTVHQGQLDIFGDEQAETVVKPKKKDAGKGVRGQSASFVILDEIQDYDDEARHAEDTL